MTRLAPKPPITSRHFTENEMREILESIIAESRKDSSFEPTKFLDGSEWAAILQDGENRKVNMKDFADYVGREVAPVIAVALTLQKIAADKHFNADRKLVHDEIIPLLKHVIEEYGPTFKGLIELLVKLFGEISENLTSIQTSQTQIISDIKEQTDEIDDILEEIQEYLGDAIYKYLTDTIYPYLEKIYGYLSSSETGYLQASLSNLFSSSLSTTRSTLQSYIDSSVTTITNYFNTTIAVGIISDTQINGLFS